MQIVRSAFGNAFYDDTGVASVLSIVAGGDDRDFRNRLLTWSYYGCAAPVQAVYAYAVDEIVIGVDTLSVGNRLGLILSLENLAVSPARALILTGEKDGLTKPVARTFAKYARHSSQQFVGIAPRLGHLKHLLCSNRALIVCRFSLEQLVPRCDRNLLRCRSGLKSDVE